MPIVQLYLNPDFVNGFHEILVAIYSEWEQPKGIDPGVLNPGIIDSVCYLVSQDYLYGQKLWQNIIHRAAYMLFNLNRGHPFVDGNKRTSLFATYFFLRWNGIYLNIPDDADELILAIANETNTHITVNDAYLWIYKNMRCRPKTLFYHFVIVNLIYLIRITKSETMATILNQFLFVSWPVFFRNVLMEVSARFKRRE